MNTNKIIEKIVTSESGGILHTWFYDSLGYAHLEKYAVKNNLMQFYSTNDINFRSLLYVGEYLDIMKLELLSEYYKECFNKRHIIDIEDSEIIGWGTDFWPSSRTAADIDKCISKTVEGWYDEIEAMDTAKLIYLLNVGRNDIVNEDNIYEVKEGILNWLNDDKYGASALIRNTIVHDTAQLMKKGILKLNSYI